MGEIEHEQNTGSDHCSLISITAKFARICYHGHMITGYLVRIFGPKRAFHLPPSKTSAISSFTTLKHLIYGYRKFLFNPKWCAIPLRLTIQVISNPPTSWPDSPEQFYIYTYKLKLSNTCLNITPCRQNGAKETPGRLRRVVMLPKINSLDVKLYWRTLTYASRIQGNSNTQDEDGGGTLLLPRYKIANKARFFGFLRYPPHFPATASAFSTLYIPILRQSCQHFSSLP